MPIEIEDLSRFGAFVANEAKHNDPKRKEGAPNVFQKLACAERWGEHILRLTNQYGGPIEDNIKLGLDYAQKTPQAVEEYEGPRREGDETRYDTATVFGAAHVLSRFWKHRDAMKRWLDTQVATEIVVISEKS